MKKYTNLCIVLLFGAFIVAVVDFDRFPSDRMKNYYFRHGSEATGAINLVTAIYLGYRAFDTLGETVVLLVSIGGVLLFLEKHHA